MCRNMKIIETFFFAIIFVYFQLYIDEAETEGGKRKKHGMLKMYYGIEHSQSGGGSLDPCDINGAHFEADTYLSNMIKQRSLTELMDEETKMVTQIRALDSDMQTLVYENYNKFISATDTIRKVLSSIYLLGCKSLWFVT